MVSPWNVHCISFDLRDLADRQRPRNRWPGGGSPDWTRTSNLPVNSRTLSVEQCAWRRVDWPAVCLVRAARLPVVQVHGQIHGHTVHSGQFDHATMPRPTLEPGFRPPGLLACVSGLGCDQRRSASAPIEVLAVDVAGGYACPQE